MMKRKLSESRLIRIEKEQTNKNICFNDSKKRSRQHRKYLKTRLVKHKRSHSSTSADPSSNENIEEISRRKKDNYTDSSCLERPNVGGLIKKMTILTIPLGKSENALIPGKMM
jgi:ribonuclease HII